MQKKKPPRLQDTLRTVRKNWTLIAQSGAWLFGLVASFLTPLPYESDFSTVTGGPGGNGTAHVAALGRVVVVVLVGLFLLPALRWRAARHAWKWGAVSAVFLVILLGGFFVLDGVTNACVVTYRGSRLLIGTTYTPEATSYLQNNRVTTRELIDQYNVSRMDRIWTTESMLGCRRRLLVLYFMMLPISIVTILSTLQAIRCIGSPM